MIHTKDIFYNTSFTCVQANGNVSGAYKINSYLVLFKNAYFKCIIPCNIENRTFYNNYLNATISKSKLIEHNSYVTQDGTGTQTAFKSFFLRTCTLIIIRLRILASHGQEPGTRCTIRHIPIDNKVRVRRNNEPTRGTTSQHSQLPSELSTNYRLNIETRRRTGTRGDRERNTHCFILREPILLHQHDLYYVSPFM